MGLFRHLLGVVDSLVTLVSLEVRFQYPAVVLFDVEFVVDFHQAASALSRRSGSVPGSAAVGKHQSFVAQESRN